MESSDYRQKVEEQLQDQRWNIADEFNEIICDYETNPRPFQEVYNQVSRLFNHDPELLSGFQEFLLDTYPAQNAQVLAAQAKRDEAHRKACEQQSNSPLLTLPREIRDKIWDEVVLGNVVHVSPRKSEWPSLGRKSSKFCFHACRAEKGAGSSACPPGLGDHADCSTTGPSNYPDIRLACKQLLLELPDAETTFFSKTAFQFADLEIADAFLFGLSEPQRSSITHLKLAVPHNVGNGKNHELWTGIVNYFSNPWERKSLHMDPKPEDKPAMLREVIYFYYSGCYYENNKDRMHKRYQVGRGGWSWDVGISDLKYKGEPKLDLAVKVLTHHQAVHTWDPDDDFYAAYWWRRPLLQFRQYDGLTFQLYNNDGLTSSPEFENFVAALKERMVEPAIGPRKCMFFSGDAYGDGDQSYASCVGSN